jgi:parvulin-like peptidyl-prolyl isomerase
MKRRSLAALGLLLLGSVTFAAAPAVKPWKPAEGRLGTPADSQPASPDRKYVHYVNGVPDTGQFLPDTAVLGSMDERQFTVMEFRQAWFASYALDRPAADSAGRFQFLTAMADKEVLARLARQVNRPFDFEDRAVLREHTQRVVSNMTFQRLVADSASPSEAELRRAYQQSLSVRHFQRIVTAASADAEQARAELAAGKLTWPEAVTRYSIAPQDSGPSGDMGWVQRNELPLDQALALCDLKDGQLSKVYLGKDGFQLLRLLGRRPNLMPPYERVRGILANQIAPVTINQRVQQIRTVLRERAGLTYDSTSIAWAAAQFAKVPAVKSRADGTPVLDMTGKLPRLTATDTARVLARSKEGPFTLGRFLSVYRALTPLKRPEVQTFESFRSFLDGSVLEPYMADLGRERGIDRDPITVAMIEKKREEIMVQHLFQDSVESKVWITPAERQQYYQSRLSDFWSYQGVRYAAIARGTRAAADSLADRLRRGELAVDVLRADSLRLGRSTGSIRFEREDQPGPFFSLLSQEMKPGQVTVEGPVKNDEYAVIQKLEHDPGRQLRYDEVEKIVDESLQNIKAERRLKEFIARHRAGHRIVLHPELMMLVRLTDPLDD